MSRAVYIGGLNNGAASEELKEELSLFSGAGDLDTFTFSYAMSHPEEIHRVTSVLLRLHTQRVLIRFATPVPKD